MVAEKFETFHLASDGAENLETCKKSSVRHQYFAVLVMDLLSFSYGSSCGWPSASIPILKSDETPFESGPITTNDASWIASGICIGGFFGNLFFGWLSAKVGQRGSLYIIAFPQILGWILIYYATNPYYLIASRVMSGCAGGGLFSVIPGYISEISDDKVRGTLGSTFVFACNLGLLFSYICGEYLQYLTIPWVMIPPTLIFIVFFIRVPNSPTFLAKRNLFEEAEHSLLYFKSIKRYSKVAKEFVNDDLRKLKFDSNDDDSKVDFKSKSDRKALIYGICLMALNQFCGCFAMMTSTATIFKESGSNLSPNVSSIIVGGIQIIGSIFPTLLVERLGRKMMMGLSAYGASIGLSILGGYTFLKSEGYNMESFTWIPLATFSFVIFIVNWGVMTLPFMILNEISQPKIRGFVTILCMSFLWIFAFIALKYTPLLIEFMGMHGTMFLFAINSLAGALFVTVCLPETKGKSFDEIVELLER